MRRTPTILSALLLLATATATAPTRAEAQLEQYDYENLAFSGIGAFLYAVAPAQSEPTLALQLRADLGLLGPNIRIAPAITFWSTELRQGEIAKLEDQVEGACERGGAPCPGISLGEVRISDLSLDVDAHYLWTTDFGVEPYAGVGVGVHLVNGRGDVIDGTFVEDVLDAITPGVNAMGGLEIPLGSLRLHGEVRGVLAGSTRWVGVGVGGSWTFPSGPIRPPASAARAAALPAPGARR